MITSPEHRTPAGPRWLRGLQVNDTQVDGHGIRWQVSQVSDGGRTLTWITLGGRVATTTAAPTHPDYPTDEEIAAARAAARKARR